MNWKIIQWRSLNTRVTIFTLIIFVVSLWSLAFYATRMLRTDMERQLGEQQFSTVSLVATDINWELDDRLKALEAVAGRVRPTLLGNPAALQIHLEERLGLLQMFNGGTFVTGIDGTAIASIPISVGRIGVNYLDRDFIIAALKEGKPAIGKPAMGKLLKSPVFVMAVPIRDAQGKVIGALMGVTDLGQPGFLDKIAGNTYGKTGGYVLIERQSRLVVTATDRSRIMESLPAAGVHAVVDRFAQGYEGSAVSPNPKGVEVLVSGKGIPVAGWYLLASLPTEEAFAPIGDMRQRMIGAALILTLLAGGLTWWMLRRQLAPMLAASKLLATLSATNLPPQPLPITRQDEIGDLIGGFNRLLETLQQRDAELRESEFRWKFAIEGSGDGLWDWNVPQSAVFFSPRWKEMLGFAPDEIGSGLDEWSKRVHPDDLVQVMADVQAHLDGTTPLYINEHRVSCKDGSYKWILDRGLVVERDAAGKPLRVIGTHSDVTERKRAEEALRESELRFSLFMENLPACAYIKDEQGRHIFVNAALATQTMTTVGSLLGKANGELWPKDIAAKLDSADAAVITSRSPLTIEEDVLMNNAVRTYLTTKFSIERANGETFLAGVSFDITERKQAEAELAHYRGYLEELVSARTAELEQSRDAAEAGNRAKTIFLATMSHEMRTPMNGVIGMVDLALRRATDPKQIDWLKKCQGSAKHLLDVIGDILDISHLEAEKMTLEEKNFSLTQVIEDALQMQGEAAQAKGLQLSTVIPPALPDMLCGDPTRLRQILINFVGNAIKFSDHGQITVNARAVEEDRLGVLLRIDVTDQGIGISPAQQARLFHAFTQADGTMNRKYGGTGLGLSIAKRIALLMGGDAAVISEEGQGSTFWVTVRLKKGTDVVEAPPTVNVDAEAEIRRRYSGHRILVVDDEPINREVAQMQLEFVDLVTDTAEDGAEAVAMAMKNSYAAIFMDMQMPKLNGVEATQQIRQLPGYRDTPIIAMTANAFAEDKAECFATGMNDFLIKPFNPDQLFAILLRALSRRSE
jgi:PAS domain S-box-containing protein